MERKICENCKTGQDAYNLDKQLPMCPYIESWKHNKCDYYVPLKPMEIEEQEEQKEDSLLSKILKRFKLI